MPLDSDDLTRCLRRYSNQNKSHLPKYSSLPELQLVMKETTLCRCRQCGFTNSFININAWTCKEGQHEFASSVPRARRASAPPNVFIKIDLSPWKFTFLAGDHAHIDFNRLEAPLKQTESSSIIESPPMLSVSSLSPHMQTLEATAVDLHQVHIDTSAVNDCRQRDPVTVIPEILADVISDVTTGTPSPLTHTHQSTIEQTEYTPEQHNNAMGLKLSQGTFSVSPTDKIPEFHCDDTHELGKYPSLSHDHELTTPPIKPAHPKHQILRPLRRKNHLHVNPCPPAADASEPIAISLTLHHSSPPTSSQLVKKSSQRLTHPYTGAHSHLQSSVAVSSSSGVTPPLTPTHQQRSSAPPKLNPESSPVRLGHPSRPYYTAIRKNGISPPTPSRSRPQSQPPPSSFHLGFDLTPVETTTMANSSRHLSMSAVLPIPPAFSALYDADDDEVRDDNGNYEVHSGPTNSARLSLSTSHRVSYDNHTQTHALNAQSPAKVAKEIIGNSRSNGVGFSMSGETELRMALATSSVATTTLGRKTQGEFRFRETVIPSENATNKNQANTGSEYHDTRYVGSKDSFMGRVKKLRKGLKEMLMN